MSERPAQRRWPSSGTPQGQPAQQPEVAGVIDHGLDPECPTAFEVGLHPGVPEVGVEGDLVTGAQQPGAVTTLGCGNHPGVR
jgi:hypothetical protein